MDRHREAVRAAIFDAAWELVRERGPLGVTMSHVAQRAGIGRATLYKYFPDLDAILRAYHLERVAEHMESLDAAQLEADSPGDRLYAVLLAYGRVERGRERGRLRSVEAALHTDPAMETVHARLLSMVTSLIADAARSGVVRSDRPPELLAAFCLSSLTAAPSVESPVEALVDVVFDGLADPSTRRLNQVHSPPPGVETPQGVKGKNYYDT